jgi:hypothetical protein
LAQRSYFFAVCTDIALCEELDKIIKIIKSCQIQFLNNRKMKRMKRQLDVARDVAHALGALGAKVVFSVARHQLKRCFEGLRIGCCFGMTRKRQCGCHLSYSPDRTIEHTPVVWLGLGVVPTGLLGVIIMISDDKRK